MPLSLADRVGETTTTTGTGTINLAGAKTGYQGFVAAGLDGLVVPYVIAHQSADEWEVGYGTVTDATPDTLSRTVVYSSSNAGSLVSFSAGTKDVYLTLPVDLFRQAGAPNRATSSPTTGNITAAVNTFYDVNLSGLTANRNFTIPSGKEGDWIDLYVNTGHATYALIIIGNTGVSINGGSGATEWSRVFIANETVRLECTATNSWRVRIDGRKPQTAAMNSTVGQSISSATWTLANMNNEEYDVGDIASTSTELITVRRTGKYLFTWAGAVTGISDQKINVTALYQNGAPGVGTELRRALLQTSTPSTTTPGASGSSVVSLTAGDTIGNYLYHNHGSALNAEAADNRPRLICSEILG